MTAFPPRTFGSTGMRTSALGIASSFGVGASDVERAFDRGVNFFLWGSIRRAGFGVGVKNLGQKHRDEMVVAIQTYTRFASLMEWSVDRALRALKTDYVDVLTLAWWNGVTPERILEAALRIREKGKARHLMVSCHHRPTFERFIEDPRYGGIMLRYNAAHPGAEREVFPFLEKRRPGTVSFTATRWGTLLDPKYTPAGEATPRASDCYRFALTNPNIDVCLSGPKNGVELDEALEAVARGPLDEAELAWMRRVGAHVRDATANRRSRQSIVQFFDRLATFSLCKPKQLASG